MKQFFSAFLRSHICTNFRLPFAASAAVGALAACTPSPTPEAAADRFLARASASVMAAAVAEGLSVEPAAAVSAIRSDGGTAVFLPQTDEAGGFVGWLDLPDGHACRQKLPASHYAVTAKIAPRDVDLVFRQLDGPAGLDPISIPVEVLASETPVTPMARVALGPDSFLLGRWFTCSTGSGHCGYALTLDDSTPGCGDR